MQRNDLLGVLVATFPNRACADEAVRDLHHAGVRHTWLGITRGVVSERHELIEPVGIGHVIARWFHRAHDETLYDALCEHGVAEAEARRIDGAIAEGNCVLIAEDVLDPTEAAAITRRHGGMLLVVPDEIEPSAYPPERDPMADTRPEAARRHPAPARKGAEATP